MEMKISIIYLPGISEQFLQLISKELTPKLQAVGIEPVFTSIEFKTLSVSQCQQLHSQLGQVLKKLEDQE